MGSILHESLCVYRETYCQEMGRWNCFPTCPHIVLWWRGVMKKKRADVSAGWNCGPHINFCSIIFFLMQCVRKFRRPETMCCEVQPLLPLPIMQTVASVPCLLPLVYAKWSFCMGKGEDLNEEFFAVTDERFLTQEKPSLLICWDFMSKLREPLQCLQVYGHWQDAATSSATQNH